MSSDRRSRALQTIVPLIALLLVLIVASSSADCPDGLSSFGGTPVPNVFWSVGNNVTACPAGDTTDVTGHPSRLRVLVTYQDANCNPKVGVPPESLVIVWVTLSGGNARINDKSSLGTHADHATDINGQARFTFPSLSGCGNVRLYLTVSGAGQGFRNVAIRSVDKDNDLERRVVSEAGKDLPACDLDWNGVPNTAIDQTIAMDHDRHWHRNALHGTPIPRTHLCEVNCDALGKKYVGSSDISWSPNGRWLAFTVEDASVGDDCHVHIVRSDSIPGTLFEPRQSTFGAGDDYGPSWSPLGHEFVVGRDFWQIWRKGIVGVAADTNEYLVVQSGDAEVHGDLTPAISPDGQTVAFGRRDPSNGAFDIWKVSIAGGVATQVSNGGPGIVNDQYPQWSVDGRWIIFDHEDAFHTTGHRAWKVLATPDPVTGHDSLQLVHSPGDGKNTATPAFSPDGKIVTAGIGTFSDVIADTRTYTLDPLLPIKKPILNYDNPRFAIADDDPVLSPRLSPDGTRLALRSSQLHAVRRNMNLPPVITGMTTNGVFAAVPDTAATVAILANPAQTLTVQVSATDADDGNRTYHAGYLVPGMNWNPTTRTLTWNPGIPGLYHVKFWVTNGSVAGGSQTGGMDAIIAMITVVDVLEPQASRTLATEMRERDAFAISTSLDSRLPVKLTIFDVSGRRVARIVGASGTRLSWDQRRAAPGIYLYRVERGPEFQDGKVVVLR